MTGGTKVFYMHTERNVRAKRADRADKAYRRGTASGKSLASGKGYAMIELVLVISLLALFGIATLSLVITGSAAYENINGKKELDSELRVALSYLDTKVKQNDSEGALSLASNPAGDGPALVVREIIGETQFETWIYLSEGKLREVLIEKGEPVLDDLGFDIAKIDGFTAEFDTEKMLLQLNIWCASGDNRQSMDTNILIKSGLEVTP